MFSFNSPFGACPTCSGLGVMRNIPADLVLPDRNKSLNQGAINAMGWNSSGDENSTAHMMFVGLSEKYHFSMDTPVKDLPDKVIDILLYGTRGAKVPMRFTSISGSGVYNVSYEGIIPTLLRRYRETTSESAKAMYEQFMREEPCLACKGQRLKPEALAVTVGGTAVTTTNPTLVPGTDYTLLVHGTAAAPLFAWITDDNAPLSDSTKAKLRLVNGTSGFSGSLSMTIDGSPLTETVATGASSSYVSQAATTTADIAVAATTALYTATDRTFTAGGVYSVFLLGASGSTTGVFRQDR